MEFKLGNLDAAIRVMNKLIPREHGAVLSYRILQISRALSDEARTFDEALHTLKLRYALCDENGEPVPDEEGNLQFEDSSKEDSFYAEVTELLNTELTLHVDKIPLSLLDREGVSLTPSDVAAIEYFIDSNK